MNRCSALLLFLLLPAICFAQPDTLWSHTYGGAGDEYASGVIALPDGSIVVSGTTNSFGAVGMDFYVLHLNPANGDTLWTRLFGRGTGDDWCGGVARTTEGYIVPAGYGLGTETQHQVMRAAFFNLSGENLAWLESGDSSADVTTYAVCANTNGRIAMAGSRRVGNGPSEVAVKEAGYGNPGGFMLSAVRGYSSQANAIAATAEGGYIVGGSSRPAQNSAADYLLIRLNAQGDTMWTHTYGGVGEAFVSSVVQTHDGGFAFTGPSDSLGPGGDIVIIKVNSIGVQEWMRTYGGTDEEHGHVIIATNDGGYLVAGHTNSFGSGGDIYVVRTDAFGNLLWSRNWGGEGLDVAQGAVELPEGGYILAGYTTSFGAGSSDLWVLRIASDLAAGDPEIVIPSEFHLAQNYPNPFNASTRISYELPRGGRISLKVFDLLGQERATLFEGEQTAGRHEALLAASSLPSGVYFYRLNAPGWSNTRKLMILK